MTGPQAADRHTFDREWQQALSSRDPRWFSYPAEQPATQTEVFELVKAGRIGQLLSLHGIGTGRILELGCGSAGMSVYLANLGFQAFAVDISTNAVEVARINAERHGAPPGFGTLRCDVLALPFADRSFDVVMSYGLLEHFQEQQVVLLVEAALRALRPGGLFLADIVPGPARFTARTVSTAVGYVGSLAWHLLRGRARQAGRLHRDYFAHYYENTLDDRDWAGILTRLGLRSVQVEVCRPFPPLALAGRAEGAYVRLMQAAMPLWLKFDGRNSWLSRHWGWMYLAHGTKGES
jgi:SAM-dependent methyltransferase